MLFKRPQWGSTRAYRRLLGLLICSLAATALLAGFVRISHPNTSKVSSVTTHLSPDSYFDVADGKWTLGLPVANIKSHPVQNAWGTVVFLPQYHKNPGTSSGEQKNDLAQVAQEQIYQILKFLTEKPNLNLVLVEGELYGGVPNQKIARISQEIADRNELTANCDEIDKLVKENGLDPKLVDNLHKKIMDRAKEADREVILAGAPFKLKAEGAKIDLFGLENSATLEESADLARNYIYLQDRIDQLKGSLSYQPQGSLSLLNYKNDRSFSANENILNLLKQFLGGSANYEFRALESVASIQGKEDLLALLKKTEEVFNRLGRRSQEKGIALSGSSRSDNPYKNVTSEKELQLMMADTEKQIDEVIVKKRNHETAENLAMAMKEKGQKTGILQFGAGHEEGLTQELNEQGLSVVVVTTNEVAFRNNSLQ